MFPFCPKTKSIRLLFGFFGRVETETTTELLLHDVFWRYQVNELPSDKYTALFGLLGPKEQPQIVYVRPGMKVTVGVVPATPKILRLGSFAQAAPTRAGVRAALGTGAI